MSGKPVIEGLKSILADTFVLYFKTHSFHWNVEGPQFKALHDLFMLQYTEMWTATDEIAERIRALGGYAPDSMASLLKAERLGETGQTPDAAAMLSMLAKDNKSIADNMKPVLQAAQADGDEVTADLMIQRMAVHEKAAWMLRSFAKGA